MAETQNPAVAAAAANDTAGIDEPGTELAENGKGKRGNPRQLGNLAMLAKFAAAIRDRSPLRCWH